jgi:hypothetical protein
MNEYIGPLTLELPSFREFLVATGLVLGISLAVSGIIDVGMDSYRNNKKIINIREGYGELTTA